MMKLDIRDENKRWRYLLAFMAAALLFYYMLAPVAPRRWAALYHSYGKVAIAAMIALYFFKRGFSGVLEVKLVIFYTVWVYITRLLCGDYYLEQDFDLVLSRLLCCVFFTMGFVLEPDEREKMLDVLIAVFCAFYFITALLGLYTCILDTYFYLPPEGVIFGHDENSIYGSHFLMAWETNRTLSAVWFYLAWCMMAYEFFHCRKKLWRFPIVLAWITFHLTLAFCYCRSIQLAVSLSTALLLILLGMKRLKVKEKIWKALLLVLIAVSALFITYKSFEVVLNVTADLYNASESSDPSDNSSGTGERDFSDSRDLKESVSSGSGRLVIYSATLPALRQEPLRLLTGKRTGEVMSVVNQYLLENGLRDPAFPMQHMHNYLLQTLMLTGLVGFLPVLAFSVLLVIRMIRLFFSSAVSLPVKSLTLPLSGIMVYGMFETVIFTNCVDLRSMGTDFRELAFFLLAGFFLAYYYEAFPGKKKQQKNN